VYKERDAIRVEGVVHWDNL